MYYFRKVDFSIEAQTLNCIKLESVKNIRLIFLATISPFDI